MGGGGGGGGGGAIPNGNNCCGTEKPAISGEELVLDCDMSIICGMFNVAPYPDVISFLRLCKLHIRCEAGRADN